MKKPINEPAFPHGPLGDSMQFEDGRTSYQYQASAGMSLLDWFAGQALAGMMANSMWDSTNPEEIADSAYLHAEEMMDFREKMNKFKRGMSDE